MHENKFIKWVHSIQPTALEFNPGSTQQMQQLLFGPCFRKLSKEKAEKLQYRKKKSSSEEEDMSSGEEELGRKDDNKLIEVVPSERTFKVDNVYVR
jgi:hypothetical protein